MFIECLHKWENCGIPRERAFQAGNRNCKGLEAELWLACPEKSKEARLKNHHQERGSGKRAKRRQRRPYRSCKNFDSD